MPSSMQPTMAISIARKRLVMPRLAMTPDRLVAREVWAVITLMMMPQAAVGTAISAADFAPSMQHFHICLRPAKLDSLLPSIRSCLRFPPFFRPMIRLARLHSRQAKMPNMPERIRE